jgi:hypothetical protein
MTKMIKTGKICSESGVYKCPACEGQVSMAKGEVMPPCDKCGQVVWEQVLKL